SVTIEMALANLERNADTAKKIIGLVAAHMPGERECGCGEALKNAIITAPEKIPERMKKDLDLLIGKYIK
ncbi:MAG: S-methyl-5'-thioadenosine phosphorylase, partial [Dehalococcoidia bacterium]|nr:S-methyl-5'-thioadenosine phosphorylase [Dehalococcoidia bacterium]